MPTTIVKVFKGLGMAMSAAAAAISLWASKQEMEKAIEEKVNKAIEERLGKGP